MAYIEVSVNVENATYQWYENDGTGEYLYRLPHRGFIDCDGEYIILMTTGGGTIRYSIKKPNPKIFQKKMMEKQYGQVLLRKHLV